MPTPTSVVAEKTDGGAADYAVDNAGQSGKPKAETGKKGGGKKAGEKFHNVPSPSNTVTHAPLTRKKNFGQLHQKEDVGITSPAEKVRLIGAAETPMPGPCPTPVPSPPQTRSAGAGPDGGSKVKGVLKAGAKRMGKGKSADVGEGSLKPANKTDKTVSAC